MTPKQINKLRKRLNMTYVAFAAAVGVSERSIYRWEKGEAKPLPLARKALISLRDSCS